MAKRVIKAAKNNLKCKILNIVPDPKLKGRMIVSIEFDDGDERLGPWVQGFSLLPDKILTIEDLMNAVYTQDLHRPEDPYQILKKWKESGEFFELRLTAKIDSSTPG